MKPVKVNLITDLLAGLTLFLLGIICAYLMFLC